MASFGVDSQPARPATAYRITPAQARKRSFGKKSGPTPASTRYGCMVKTWNTTSHARHMDPAITAYRVTATLASNSFPLWMAADRIAVGKGISADVNRRKRLARGRLRSQYRTRANTAR